MRAAMACRMDSWFCGGGDAGPQHWRSNMQMNLYEPPMTKGPVRTDAGFWFAAGVTIVAIVMIALTLALGIKADPDGSMAAFPNSSDTGQVPGPPQGH